MKKIMDRIKAKQRYFMTGRYGTDKLNMALLSVGLVLCAAVIIIPNSYVDLALTVVSYGLILWVIFRTFSRNIYRRYQENRKYLRFLEQIKDKEHRYYDCPRCRQTVRVPKGKGKISITCPKCKEKFIKKT